MAAKKPTASAESTADKREALLKDAMAKMDKRFGAGSVMEMGSAPQEELDIVPSGSLAIDIALGRGGLPRGRIIEIWGPESSGKTLFTLHAMAEVQKLGGRALFIDAEHAFDPAWARRVGVDVDKLMFAQPMNGEEAFEILDTFAASGAVDIIVVDSVAALIPKSELEGDFGQATMGVQARMMSQGLRKITGTVKANNVIVIFINQVREKIGVMFGSPKTTTGGNALKFYASIRMEIARISYLKEGDNTFGAHTRLKVVKNKVAPPMKQAEFDIIWKEGEKGGYSREADIRKFGTDAGILKKSGSYYRYKDEIIGNGDERTRRYLVENPEVADEIEELIRKAYLETGEAQVDELSEHEVPASELEEGSK